MRSDLSTTDNDFETIWIEINNYRAEIIFFAVPTDTHLVIQRHLENTLSLYYIKFQEKIKLFLLWGILI